MRRVHEVALLVLCLIGAGIALGRGDALALLPLVVLGLALAEGEVWAVFGLSTLAVTLSGAAGGISPGPSRG